MVIPIPKMAPEKAAQGNAGLIHSVNLFFQRPAIK